MYDREKSLALRRPVLFWIGIGFCTLLIIASARSCAQTGKTSDRQFSYNSKAIVCSKTGKDFTVVFYSWRRSKEAFLKQRYWNYENIIKVSRGGSYYLYSYSQKLSEEEDDYRKFNNAKDESWNDWKRQSDFPPDYLGDKLNAGPEFECSRLQVQSTAIYQPKFGISWDGGVSFTSLPEVPQQLMPSFIAKSAFEINGQRSRALSTADSNVYLRPTLNELVNEDMIRRLVSFLLPTKYSISQRQWGNKMENVDSIEWRKEPSLKAVYELRRADPEWKLISLEQVGALDVSRDIELILPRGIPLKKMP
jgi:hypothetical protein